MDADPTPSHFAVRFQPLLAGLGGGLLLWLAQPTVSWWPLAWLAPIPWLWLANEPKFTARRPYWQLWLAGSTYWLAALYWIPMAHPLQYFSWLALGLYLGVYLPLFVKLVRVAASQFALPVWLAAPIVWVACEYGISHLLTGIALAMPAHTQVHWPTIVQCVDLAGPYTLSFLMMLVPAAVITAIDSRAAPLQRVAGPIIAAIAMVAAVWYGQTKLGETLPASAASLRVSIVQGNEAAVWEADPDRDKRVLKEYVTLTREAISDARARDQPIDLVVWPENMFRIELWLFDPDFVEPREWPRTPTELAAVGPAQLALMAADTGANLLVGIDRLHGALGDKAGSEPRITIHNSAAVVTRDGELVGVYDKMHLVPFGEYLPFARLVPWLYEVTPMGLGLTPGDRPIAPKIDGVRIAPNICYESVLPHVIREQVAELMARDERPELLANLTNDSWFRKSSELDMHLACNILRAVENRTPMIVAGNGGLSASIDRWGRLLAVTEKQTAEVLVVDVVPGAGHSLYLQIGDWPAFACVVLTIVLMVVAIATRGAQNRSQVADET